MDDLKIQKPYLDSGWQKITSKGDSSREGNKRDPGESRALKEEKERKKKEEDVAKENRKASNPFEKDSKGKNLSIRI